MLDDKREPEDWTIFTENMREASDENLQKALNSIRVVMEMTKAMQDARQIMKQTSVVDEHDDERDKANNQIYEDGVRSIEIIEAEIERRKASSVG